MSELELKNLNRIDCNYVPYIKRYVEKVYTYFENNLKGMLIYGSVARNVAKPINSMESDIDMIIVIEGLVDWKNRTTQKSSIDRDVRFGIEAIWLTPKDLDGYFVAKTGFILDAFYDGIIVYDPYLYLEKKKQELLFQLEQKGVKRVSYGWIFPIKVGEKVEY